jgi:pimeloyl-ACP methyl ester carboxylesterase
MAAPLAVWSGGAKASAGDVWFLHAFGDAHDAFAGAFSSPLAARARLLALDLPGHGDSPPMPGGLTVKEAAVAWCELIERFSAARPIVLVAHSMAAMIACSAAGLLKRPPQLVVSVEGNLTAGDAYLTGQAARFDDPDAFHAHFKRSILELAAGEESLRRYAENVRRADATTLWILGRSVAAYPAPGEDFRRLACPTRYYWDPQSVGQPSTAFIAAHGLRERTFPGLGHWPMIRSPARFYAALDEDITFQ